eukprot:CAMPEP_0114535982 /NCGR_PEP_ID=MMETSP0109-20121206/28741_1 /TAXON_ID=29199 /ORGANISM="Chlorarachnion reptans, Strain CCCM449" /LENGTH=767 /DNA_ID=CAMNT_0001719653 /DNA_START=152 /DNA_END=2455 /DNA_ORIENTATION=-
MGICSSGPPEDPPKDVTANERKVTDAEVESLLQKIPLLARMTGNDRHKICENLKEETFKNGENIITQGDSADKFYIVKKGSATVLVDNNEVGKLSNGEFFGEQALVNANNKRNATIRADGVVRVFTLTRNTFHKIFDDKAIRKLFPKRQAVSGISGKVVQGAISKPANATTEKSDADKKLITNALKTNPLMKTMLGEEQVQMIIAEMWKMKCPSGKDIIKEGAKGDNFYIIISGTVGIYKASGDGKKESRITERGAGQSFGEIALMYNCERKATVRCETESEFWAIDRYTFKRISTNTSAHMLDEYERFLSKVENFDKLTKFERSRIAEALEEVPFSEGDVIIKQGDNGDSFFILKYGQVVVSKAIEGKHKEVFMYNKPGQFFGERAILKDEKRAATCTATKKTVCLMLKRDVFELLLGPLRELMERDGDARYKVADKKGVGEQVDDGAHIRTSFKGTKDFRTVGILGKGSFGSVKLVEANGKRYALKAVGKERVENLGQQEHIMNERNIMLRINHPFIVVLFQTFQDKDYLYFLLEPSLGGELFSVLRVKSYFKQDEARFFAASVVSVFEYLHSKDIIYRDLKPENLLLDDRGYLKVTDFGFAKEVKGRTWTLCGTPDYLAPEIISSRSHGKGVDWWTLGILCYEMLVSYPPFYDQDPMKVYAKIMLAKLKFPKGFNKNAEALIRELLRPKPSSRLGVVAGGATKVKNHPWFKEFSFQDLLDRKIKAPIVQNVDQNNPLLNFEEYDDFSETEQYKGDNKDFVAFDS